MSNNSKKQNLTYMFITWVILTILMLIMAFYVPTHWMPRTMSDSMHLTVLTMIIFTVAAAPVAAGVYAGMLHLLQHIHKGDTPPAAGPATRENNKIVTSWLLVSAVLTVFLLIWGLGALSVDDSSSANPLIVNVTGQQWVWSFSYPGTHVVSNELYLPKGREVEFHVTSEDITHGFWIANMGVQMDANSGTVTTIHTTPTALGTFNIRCTQFCGLNHAFMVTQGHVLTPAAFTSWLAAQPARA